MISWKDFPRPIIALSPMADMTDSPFCRIAKQWGWPVVFREMVSSEALVRESAKTLHMAAFHEEERPLIQQIFGKDPLTMARAAEIIEKNFAPDGIDINMGCPVYKLVSDFNGACLMKDPERACAIVREMKRAVAAPISVKIRLGWTEKTDCLDFIKRLEDAGAELVTIHGRTRAAGYSGVADWEMIGRARREVSIPVLCNGDIHTPEAVFDALRVSGCDGVLIARGALGCPWFYRWFQEIAETGARQTEITIEQRVRFVMEHLQLHCAEYGEHGVVTFRKHLSYYFKGIEGMKPWREQLMKVTQRSELEKILCAMVGEKEKILA
ncbi:MAG: tRNA dihydrouridine synthase DusB [Candidatus Magasanikbacteria bacterium RIFCSPHIGHO2_01_FULL_50_8]|uniref:tRNA-dihydrouridine synthase n=1 Tax=Candidatus Magasanikbacteria bacterium RIFCSPHIGHO2_01_FULL_50_8 TaxID=1798674 RepID=A0A1F6LSB2_9BACT|nr:MAG: tRNA dihydrouridine synthase DusB [Candidatus Magasanikbacteria bacterium RIFCSPHIGHO2_01_FULL_50_8]